MEVAVTSSTIVPEVLKANNYERWSIFMKHYLVAQDLWNVVQSDQMPGDENAKEWIKKNALALHAIKVSCGVKAFERIKKIESAKCAWDELGLLVDVQKSPVVYLNIGERNEVINPDAVELDETGTDTLKTRERTKLINWIWEGSFSNVTNFFHRNPRAISARILENGYTALHVAISGGNEWIAEELITMASVEGLKEQDNSGNTALSLAACNGMMRIAKRLIKKNRELLTIRDNDKKIPVMLACGAGHENMARYLYRETPREVLGEETGFYLLQECITKKMFDIAVDLVDLVQGVEFRCPSGSIPTILMLAKAPPPFFRESQPGFWERLIYKSIRAKTDFIKPRGQQSCAQKIQHLYPSCAQKIQHFYQSCAQKIQHLYQSCAQKIQHFYQSCAQKIQHFYQSCPQKIQHFYQSCAQTIQCILNLEWPGLCELLQILLLRLGSFLDILLGGVVVIVLVIAGGVTAVAGFCVSSFFVLIEAAKMGVIALASLILETVVSVLARFLAKDIYNRKLMELYARKFIRRICRDQLSELDHYQFVQSGAMEATFQAIKNGIPEIAIAIIQANPNMLWTSRDPEDSRNMFACAVLHRQEKLVRFLYEIGVSKDKSVVFSVDEDGNNTLHLAAKLAHDSHLGCISGAALQLQSELRWFKAVESVAPRTWSEQKNKDSETPFQLFVKEHKNLQKDAEEWMKKTAESSTVVGALIITTMFAAAFAVSGGNNQNTGFPIFLLNKPVPFMVFIILDAISLFSASSAVLMFLGILTSRYAYENFLKSLPCKLIIGLSSLLISIATMMVAFCAALFITLEGRLSVVIPITLLAGIPVTSFLLVQSPLLIEICVSTFSSDIFDRKRIKNLSLRSAFGALANRQRYGRFRRGKGLKDDVRFAKEFLWSFFCVWE